MENDQKSSKRMKIKWWGWSGIALILYATKEAAGHRLTSIAPNEAIGNGLGDIAYALALLPWTILILAAGILIWLSART